MDSKLSSKVSNMKIFENLNNERPTTLFLTLTKNRSTEKLSLIKQDDGSDFTGDEHRYNHIVETFEELYRDRDPAVIPDNIIENFLGPDIVNDPLVQNSRLTVQESDRLEQQLTMAELDIAAKKGKIRSAPGADGFSNQLIIKCWKYFRFPFFAYVNHCYATGTLTHNFRSAKIKLIPKKGDISKLKNWRPISLLSNFYKILSRAINNRLSKVVNRICSRAQKGYNNTRYSQEVLINVWEQVKFCQVNDIKGAVVAIDMAKAFDTLSHKFLQQVYRFFNFGPNIINWLSLLGRDREACIALDNNLCSRYFRLGRGRPQGDNISPNTFNFADQILIFKMELDPGITRIRGPDRNQLPVLNIPNANDFFSQEANRETIKNESLADDNTTITILNRASLTQVKHVLNSFAEISGLECNFDKSCVMTTFVPDPADIALIIDLGFTYTNKIKLLGMEITQNLDNVEEIFENIKQKIIGLVSYWERFRLSLPGIITIAKTFLVSQLNYIGCFLKPSDRILDEIQVIIDNFVKKNLNISHDRVSSKIEHGGLGLFNIKMFLESQRCAWISRAYRIQNDNWRYDLKNLAPGNNLLCIRPCDVDENLHPILFDLVVDYTKFYGKFSEINGNYKQAYIFDNKSFKLGPDFTGTIKQYSFGRNFYTLHKNNFRKLKFTDCFHEGRFKTVAEFAADGLPLLPAAWMLLRSSLLRAKALLTKNDRFLDNKCTSIENFMGAPIKGSKRFRNILSTEINANIPVIRSVYTFATLVNLPVPEPQILNKFTIVVSHLPW
jgi:hypothetical protein